MRTLSGANSMSNPEPTNTLPSWTWSELEAAMASMAVHPAQRDLVVPLVSAMRKSACVRSSLDLLREILILASVVGDESFSAEDGEGSLMS